MGFVKNYLPVGGFPKYPLSVSLEEHKFFILMKSSSHSFSCIDGAFAVKLKNYWPNNSLQTFFFCVFFLKFFSFNFFFVIFPSEIFIFSSLSTNSYVDRGFFLLMDI